MDKLEIITPIVVSIILAVIGWFYRKVTKGFKVHEESHELLKTANLYQIKAQLLIMYRHAAEQGKVSSHELEVFNDLFEIYTRLGGNSFMHNMTDRMNNFEVFEGY